MLVDRLWLRIKGEFLALREDLAEEGALSRKADEFLRKLEARIGLSGSESDSQADASARVDALWKKMERDYGPERTTRPAQEEPHEAQSPSLDDLEQAWEEVKGLRAQKKGETREEEAPPPNPRTLG